MSITYKYYSGDIELTLQQAQVQYSSFDKYKFINGSLKEIYWVKNGEIIGGDYFLDINEQAIPELVQEYCIENQWDFTFYTYMNSEGDFTLWQGNHYTNEGVISSKHQLVLDQNGLDIAKVRLNFNTEDIDFGSKRYYKINPENGKKEVLIQFEYNRDTFEVESFSGPNRWDFVYGGAYIDKIYNPEVMEDFIYDNHPYYHNLLPLLPENGVV